MIHIVIPMLHSPEFPGRALQLWPYTLGWLAHELLYIGVEYTHPAVDTAHRVSVTVYGRHSEMPTRLPEGWRREYTDKTSWEEAAVEADKRLGKEGDAFVLVRTETPLRERGTLERMFEAVLCTSKPVLTASMQHRDNWREFDQDGRYCNVPKDMNPRITWDGQLLAWPAGQAAAAVAPSAEHIMVRSNHAWGSVDVSIPPDMPPGLPGMAADMLLASVGSRPIPPLRGKKVLLIGSGRDLAGRKMGEAIEAGEYGLVARCNKYYGAEEDIGRKTDIAIVRWPGWEHAFFQEAPEYPRSWITINDGSGIPPAVVNEAVAEVGHPTVSCGIIAAKWLLGCGAEVSVIGMGRNADGSRPDGSAKVYVDGTKDNNPHYDWAKEDAWWDARADVFSLI